MLLVAVVAIGATAASAAEVTKSNGCFEDWFSPAYLKAMNEPALTPVGQSRDYFAFRLIYLPTFRHAIALRYEVHDSKAIRRAVALSGMAGYDPGSIAFQKTDSQNDTDISMLKNALDDLGFWSLPPDDPTFGSDGDLLIVQVVSQGHCKAIVRWQPDYDTEQRGLSKLLALYRGLFDQADVWRRMSPDP